MKLDEYFKKLSEVQLLTFHDKEFAVDGLLSEVRKCLTSNNKLMICGNGGFSSIASHIASELVGRFINSDRKALPAISLTADNAVLTALANDYSYEKILIRQIDAFACPGDVVILLSCSGKSPNILHAIKACNNNNVSVIIITGITDSQLATPFSEENKKDGLHLQIQSSECSIIQEVTLSLLHYMCYNLETL